jgi:CelD/BcsL family acetyltransferase involved in cellulose biosynthesis
MSLTCEIVGEEAAFHGIEPDWWSLFARVPNAAPFQSPAWLLPWWRAFAPGALEVVAIRRRGMLVGLAPFYRAEDGRVLPIGISVSDYLDVLIDPEDFNEVASLLGACIGDRLAGGGEWEMTDLPPAAQSLKIVADLEVQTTAGETCPVLALKGTDLSASVPNRKLRKLRMACHRAERAGGCVIEPCAGPAVLDAFAHLVRLHGERWTGRGGGVLADPRVRRFHAEALPRLDRAGLLDVLLCRIGGVVAGVYYGFTRHDRAYAYLSGFDPRLAAASPGTLLIGRAIEAAARRGAREFHFLRGGEPYKYEWGAIDRPNTRCVFRRAYAHADA